MKAVSAGQEAWSSPASEHRAHAPARLARYRVHVALFCLAGFALVVRLIPVWMESGSSWAIANNSGIYLELAQGLRNGCGFAAWTGSACASPEISRTPGYAMLLSLLPGARAAIALQAILWSAVCLVAGLFVLRRWGWLAALITSAFLAADVSSFVYSNKIMTEVLFTSLLIGTVLVELKALERERLDIRTAGLMAFASVLCAGAIAVRPIGQFVAILAGIAPFLTWRGKCRQRLLLSALLISLPVLLVIGWRQRNLRVAGIDTYSTVGTFNLYNYRAAGTVAYATGRSLQDVWRTWDPGGPQASATHAIEIILQHPVAFASMTAESFVYVALVPDRSPLAVLLSIGAEKGVEDPGSFRIYNTADSLERSPLYTLTSLYRNELYSSPLFTTLIVFQICAIAAIWLGIARAVAQSFRGNAFDYRLVFFLSVALLMLVLASGPEASDRFRIPAIPFLAIVSAIGWCKARATKRDVADR
jgi:hypothetical protein